MRRHVLGALAAVLATTLALAGCGSGSAGSGGAASPSAAGGAFPATVHNSTGTTTVEHRPTHIVSLSPTTTEMLYAIGAGGQVKAVDDQSTYPSKAPRTKLSGFKPNVEAIAKYDPDLVVLSYDSGDVVKSLRTVKIPVYVAPAAKQLSDSYAEITDLGRLTGHTDGARDTVTTMRDGIRKAVRGVPHRDTPLSYYYELDPQLHTATSATFVGALFRPLGLTNIADKAKDSSGGYPQLSKEYLLKSDPDLIFLADTKCCSQTTHSVATRPGWSTLTAVRDKHVYPLDDDIASRWGPRVVQLVQTAAKAVASVPAK